MVCLLHLFVLSLQSKETQKVHQHFRAVPASESKKPGSEAANRPHRSPIYPYLARFYPKMQEKTPFAVVDKRGFFDGGVRGIRTLGTLLTYTRFPVVLVMTASISLHMTNGEPCGPAFCLSAAIAPASARRGHALKLCYYSP